MRYDASAFFSAGRCIVQQLAGEQIGSCAGGRLMLACHCVDRLAGLLRMSWYGKADDTTHRTLQRMAGEVDSIAAHHARNIG